jgi:hypothetical protein
MTAIIYVLYNCEYTYFYLHFLPTDPNWVRVVGYGSFFLCVIHKEGLCPTSEDINMLINVLTARH